MKKLTRIRLLNWYHILDETLPVEGSVLLMGDNGTGKSTVLDAIQLALVADLTQVRFNQAANEQASRNLQSYTRWMVNTGGGRESHQYNRNDCTSYVMLEFTEDAPGSLFTIGVVIDSFKDGRDPRRLHFAANQSGIADIPVFREGTRIPLPTAEFRRIMAPRKGFFCSHEPGAFREDLLTRLGKLSPDFTKVLVKAQAFKPLGQVQQFVMDFLLDPRPLETQSLQANLASFKSLEQKARSARERVDRLEEIAAEGVELGKLALDRDLFRYLELRASAGIQERAMEAAESGLAEATDELTAKQTEIERLSAGLTANEQTLGAVFRAVSQNEAYRERERIRRDLLRVRHEHSRAQEEANQAQSAAAERERLCRQLALAHPGEAPHGKEIEPFREFVYRARQLRDATGAELESVKAEGRDLEKRLEDLRKGVRPCPKEARTLKELIVDRLGCEAWFLCELLEVTDERWQAAVEGYLNTRRFDIILDPVHFRRALALYEQTKQQLGIHGVGLVDCEKAGAIRIPIKPGALAEVVGSPHRHAKAYADFILGDVIRCDSEQGLREHSRSITATCMVYQNHAARQTPFHVFENWYIGSRGREQMIRRTEAELAARFERLKTLAEDFTRREASLSLALQAEEAARTAIELEERLARAAELAREAEFLDARLAAVDTAEVRELERREKELREEKEALTRARDEAMTRIGSLQEKIRDLEQARVGAACGRDRCFADLAAEYASEASRARVAGYEERYAEELRNRRPDKIQEVFSSQRKNRETQKSNVLQNLTLLRSEYNNRFGFGAPPSGEDLSPYLAELDAWKTSHLPEYEQKIAAAKDAAMQQLMEDVVHRLRENLDLIPSQFEQINRALKGFHFGFDQYQFTFSVKREYQAFADLIREAAKYERQPLFETDWRERFRDGGALERLFVSLTGGSSAQVEEELRQYSDYRQYYDYDLKILHSDGTESLYSRVNRWKSGGETQAPYYIAVLASMYRLYRLQPEHAAKQRGTIGLVLLDEAFNKMDEDRLRATLQFTRKLGLQLVMATPKERAEFIIPHVETCWLVAKDPQTGLAFVEDFHQENPRMGTQA